MIGEKLQSYEQILKNDRSIYVACPKVFYAERVIRDSVALLGDLVQSYTRYAIHLSKGHGIVFLEDKEEKFRGLRGYYSTLDNYERIIEEEKKKHAPV